MAARTISPSARCALQSLGADLKVARLKRRIPVKEFTEWGIRANCRAP